MEDVKQTIIAQYANSLTLVQLIESMNQYFDPSTDFETFYDFVWNVDTAEGFGLDIWGRIVNVSRSLSIPNVGVFTFGFDEGVDYQPFGQAPFFISGSGSTTYTLDDTSYRKLILVKALGNISACSARSINALLQNLFEDRGRSYVIDSGEMTLRYTFEFLLTQLEYAILTQSGVVQRPAGVRSYILQVAVDSTFGFMEAGGQPFGFGVFF
jgi:hypothetical protein